MTLADQNVRNKTSVDPRIRASIDTSRLPNAGERLQLGRRLRRLDDMEKSVRVATANLKDLATLSNATTIRIRSAFVYQRKPAPGDPSDRRLPLREHRPPAARLIRPRGDALRLILIALFEAQMLSRRPGATPDNQRPLEGGADEAGWTDLLATDAKPAGAGRSHMGVAAKKRRHLGAALDTLAAEELVILPHEDDTRNQHRNFLLAMEWGRRSAGENDRYRVPMAKDEFFEVPITLFINGWIYVLEDSELAFLLMLALYHHNVPEGTRVTSETRLRHLGIGRDTAALHDLFERFDLVEVTADPRRRDDGTVEEFRQRGALPDHLRFLPEGLNADGLRTVMTEIDYQLSR